ncbi:hypothetical protein LCGC14_1722190 [marine sediment metagenome]|uniref:Uncharacterized protein n=1 Tax=marine sediment metagenome TaxID=412755 RepID=A0A0F9JSI9_9ZZZZ
MKLRCDDCQKIFDIPDDKWDDYNIYRKWDGGGSPVACAPHLLCRKCTDKQIAHMQRSQSSKQLN